MSTTLSQPHKSVHLMTSSPEIPSGFNYLIRGMNYPEGNPGPGELLYSVPIICRKNYDRVIRNAIKRHGVSSRAAELAFETLKPSTI